MLYKLTKIFLSQYREAYRKDWPAHSISFGLFDHYIKRIEKFPEWEEKVNFYGTGKIDKETILSDATYVFYDGYYIHFDSLGKNLDSLKIILQQIDYTATGEKVFINIKDDFRDLIHEIMQEKALEKVAETRLKSWFVDETHLDVPTTEDFLTQLPSEFYIGDIPESYADFIYAKNVMVTLRSAELIKNSLKYNPSTGIFRKSDDYLIGWILFLEYAMPANLHVDKIYQNQKLATYLSAAHYVKILKMRGFVNIAIKHDLEASKRIVNKVEANTIDNISAIVIRNSLKHRPKL